MIYAIYDMLFLQNMIFRCIKKRSPKKSYEQRGWPAVNTGKWNVLRTPAIAFFEILWDTVRYCEILWAPCILAVFLHQDTVGYCEILWDTVSHFFCNEILFAMRYCEILFAMRYCELLFRFGLFKPCAAKSLPSSGAGFERGQPTFVENFPEANQWACIGKYRKYIGLHMKI